MLVLVFVSLLNLHPEFLLQFCFRVVTSPATDQFFDFANVTFVCNTFATNKLNPFFGTRSCVRRRRRRRRTTGHLYPSCILSSPLCFISFFVYFVFLFSLFVTLFFFFLITFTLFLRFLFFYFVISRKSNSKVKVSKKKKKQGQKIKQKTK